MHRLGIRVYVGEPGETVTVTTRVEGSGRVAVRIDGNDLGAARTFPLKSNPGDETQLQVALFGATGETCVLGIAKADGGTDGDLLVCQRDDLTPVHMYTFIVASSNAVKGLAEVRGQGTVR
jgi:hypothetical protein